MNQHDNHVQLCCKPSLTSMMEGDIVPNKDKMWFARSAQRLSPCHTADQEIWVHGLYPKEWGSVCSKGRHYCPTHGNISALNTWYKNNSPPTHNVLAVSPHIRYQVMLLWISMDGCELMTSYELWVNLWVNCAVQSHTAGICIYESNFKWPVTVLYSFPIMFTHQSLIAMHFNAYDGDYQYVRHL